MPTEAFAYAKENRVQSYLRVVGELRDLDVVDHPCDPLHRACYADASVARSLRPRCSMKGDHAFVTYNFQGHNCDSFPVHYPDDCFLGDTQVPQCFTGKAAGPRIRGRTQERRHCIAGLTWRYPRSVYHQVII